MTGLRDFTVKAADGSEHALSAYAGQVVLVVNTASKCGFTPQYAGLEALWRRHRDQGLVVLGFPCNQFANQEPGDAEEIASFCSLTYDVTFPVLARIDVNGPKAEPLFQWLTRSRPGLLGTRGIKWNFTKFLVGRDGKVLKRYAPNVPPEALEADIQAALAAG